MVLVQIIQKDEHALGNCHLFLIAVSVEREGWVKGIKTLFQVAFVIQRQAVHDAREQCCRRAEPSRKILIARKPIHAHPVIEGAVTLQQSPENVSNHARLALVLLFRGSKIEGSLEKDGVPAFPHRQNASRVATKFKIVGGEAASRSFACLAKIIESVLQLCRDSCIMGHHGDKAVGV